MNNKQELIKKENDNMVQLIDQAGVENAIEKLISKNNSLLPSNVAIERIKSSAGFYIADRKDLMGLDGQAKLQMIYGVLKEAMVGCEAGTDYDIVPFKGKPVTVRKKVGWYKIIDMIKPAEIIKFESGVLFKGDQYSWNPIKGELKYAEEQIPHFSNKYEDIEGGFAYIEFANGFKKTLFISKVELDAIRKVSPSANSSFSPWITMPIKMVETKTVKELAKKLFTLYSAKVNSILAQAINNDESSISTIDKKGNIKNDEFIYAQELDSEIIEQNESVEENEIIEITEEQVDINDL